MKRFCSTICLLLFFCSVGAQPAIGPRTLPELGLEDLQQKDLSMLWIGPLPLIDRDDTTTLEWFERNESLGYIGTEFNRFKIHFTSINQASEDPLCYQLKGATSRNDTIRLFEGELRIDSLIQSVNPYHDSWGGIFSGWTIKARYTLRENSAKPNSGVLEGFHTLFIATDFSKNIYYDTLDAIGDGYYNNQWEGMWHDNKNDVAVPCNWGDYRIPVSKGLDVGCGVFIPDDEHRHKGWQSYCDLYDSDEKIRKEARSKEFYCWWNDI